MGSAFHQLCPRYSGTLTPTAPTAIRLWDTFTFLKMINFPFGTNGKLIILGVPILKHITVFSHLMVKRQRIK